MMVNVMEKEMQEAYTKRYSESFEGFEYWPEKSKGHDMNGFHITQVVTNAGGKITVVNEEGTFCIEGTPTGRGVSVFRQYYSEHDNCVYEVQERFHKGTVYTSGMVELVKVETPEGLYDVDFKYHYHVDKVVVRFADIWRD